MILFKEAAALSEYLSIQQEKGLQIGFVPTMGALHKGHISLVDLSNAGNDLTVCSIFVNPTQFNNPEDFKHYPITIEKDITALEADGCDVLFLPSVDEIYPSGHQQKTYNLGPLEHILEGKFRPGHFQGVCQVVDRFFGIVHPNNVYFGQKDFQQCMVIKKLLQLTGKDKAIQLHIAPTIRESGGLAMSSRNLRLSSFEKIAAEQIHRELEQINKAWPLTNIKTLQQQAKTNLEKNGFKVDYVEVVSTEDLTKVPDQRPAVALIAASIGPIRLIDNLLLN